VDNGASALLVERLLPLDVPQVVVADAERALARIATAMQRDRATRVFAITGSNGKTSVKTLLLAILQHVAMVEGRQVYATPGNRNNEIGMPLAVIDAPEDADFAIYEMGTGKPGDIAYLTAIAAPDVALVNNVAPAHLERMGSLLEIANTKAAVYDDLREGGVAVVNADDAFAPFFAERAGAHRVLRFGLEASADVTAGAIVLAEAGSRFRLHAPQGEAEVALQLPGRHNVLNALAAASLALAAGIALPRVAEGLAQARCWSTTATTPTRVRWPRRSPRWPRARKTPGWCWATCASSAPMPRRCMRRPAAARAKPGSSGCMRWGR